MTWQPIETAPRDGTPILIFEPDGHPSTFGRHRSHYMPREFKGGSYGYDDPRLKWYDDTRFAIGYWRPWGGWGNRNCSNVNPKHWMPLPDPPEAVR